MLTEIQASANAELDKVLELLCELLQPTPSLWQDAQQKYQAAANWLSAQESQLYSLRPDIKYQGSALIETVVRPWQREEFDVDLLCILETDQRRHPDPMAVYDLVADRLAEHATYRRLMNRKARCIELDYAGQFHLDIVPAILQLGSATKLLIPDRSLKTWLPTDPFGYADWFFGRTPVTQPLVEHYRARADVEPLRPAKRAAQILPLQRTVQLMKRRRDLYFDGNAAAPKSIALTTLTAKHYGGQALCTDALLGALDGIDAEIQQSAAILAIPNPVDPRENLGRHWNAHSYTRFTRFIRQFSEEMRELFAMRGWDRITEALEALFGERARTAVENYAKNMEARRRSSNLGYSAGPVILTPSAAPTHTVPRNEFYGR
ncbi:nucleotidyltransferase [Aeoliella sp. ICT_H6.2]|uniref:Nucleotidyltransferase n=1 Tax=Aeoliella straminimaris TaxID=2954799 RepID=A0A9X2F5S4_9BACT|nr:nucleotidyltransferase [Aeoliella straminimaris]MCO6042705.1 nucleotidyltransferase [Aeoliella straminimaris]